MSADATVFVVDDDPTATSSLRWLLESDGMSVETYSSGKEFLDAYDPNRSGCLVLDLRMPEMDGLQLQQRLLSLAVQPPVIFVTAYGDVPKCAAAMKAGAVDFIEKPFNHEALLKLVRHALEEDRLRRGSMVDHPEIAARISTLTPREREVMSLLRAGKSIKAISAEFQIGFQTAAKHRSRVLEKLHVENEAELVRLLTDYPFQ